MAKANSNKPITKINVNALNLHLKKKTKTDAQTE
jgi:hypothetical protein